MGINFIKNLLLLPRAFYVSIFIYLYLSVYIYIYPHMYRQIVMNISGVFKGNLALKQ